jgi:hypothetical protein
VTRARGPSTPRSQVLVVSPDGRRVAYLQKAPRRPDQAIAQGSRLDEVWVASADGGSLVRVFALPPVAPASPYGTAELERLIDLGWAPDGRRVLVATRIGEPLSGPVRGRRLVVEGMPSGGAGSVAAPVELVTMPATNCASKLQLGSGRTLVCVPGARFGGAWRKEHRHPQRRGYQRRDGGRIPLSRGPWAC